MFGSSVFDPHSGQAKAISDLFWATLIIASLIVLLVSLLVAYSGFKYRRVKSKDNDKDTDDANSEPKQIGGSMRIGNWLDCRPVGFINHFVYANFNRDGNSRSFS